MNFIIKKGLVFLVLICITGFESQAQRFYSVVFNNLPKDMQLYAREDDNTAEVPISGVIEIAGYDHFSVVTYRNKQRVGYMKSVLDYAGKTSANFDFKPKIEAEMADYEFEVYACKTTDSILVVKRSDVVAGDFYVISGQSNASAIHFGNWSSKYARTIARTPDDNPGIGQGDSLWIASSWSWPYTGAWGVQMQREILENEGIPTCVINGALPGSYIIYHSERNAQNPASTSLYGLLYGRIKVAKPKRIRAFFWYQGEQEAIENIPGYDKEYDKLFKYWQTDYPQVEKFVVIQIPVLFMPYYEAGKIRDFQRRTKYIYPKTDTFSASDLPGFDGIHYDLAGYQEFGRRIYHFVSPKFYGSPDSSNVDCPDIKKVFYSSEKKDEITLHFNQDQKLVWPKDTLMDDVNGVKFTKSLREVFFFDADESKPAGITSGIANGSVVTLKLPAASNAKKLTYLPAYKGEQVRSYNGPFLKNVRGLPAFSFQEITIADLLVVNPFTAKESDLATVIVSWASAGAESYVLERKTETDTDFKPVKTFDGKTLSYEDKDVSPDATYNYRIQAFSSSSQSVVKTVSIKTVPLLSVKPNAREMFWSVYPNPVSDEIRIEFKNAVTGSFNLSNVAGQKLLSGSLDAQNYHRVSVSTLPSGIYILSLTREDGSVITQKILKK
jgi:hypothetical protein